MTEEYYNNICTKQGRK